MYFKIYVVITVLLCCLCQHSNSLDTSNEHNSHINESKSSASQDSSRPKRSVWAECGLLPRIVGGIPTHISEAPYQVGIRRMQFPVKSAWRSPLICGGSLIGPRLVLSAAHCFKERFNDPRFFRVTLGATFRAIRTTGSQVRNVEKLILHPEFREKPAVMFDIALVVLDKEVKESRFIKFVELPSQPVQLNTNCTITGWGRLVHSTYERPNCMMKAIVPILDVNECRLRSTLPIVDGFLCAGYFDGGIDACSGDSGGPLVCDGVLYGIVSFGYKCAEKDNPGLYTDVYQNLEWIKKESVNSGKSRHQMVILVLVVEFWLVHKITY